MSDTVMGDATRPQPSPVDLTGIDATHGADESPAQLLSTTVAETASGVTGVHHLGGLAARTLDRASRQIRGTSSAPGVTVSEEDGVTTVDLDLVVEYPHPVDKVVETTRDQVSRAATQLVSGSVVINITVTDIHGPYDKDPAVLDAIDRAGEKAGELKDKAGDLAEQAGDKAGELRDKASDKAGELQAQAGDLKADADAKVDDIRAQADTKIGELRNGAADLVEQAGAKASELKAQADDKVADFSAKADERVADFQAKAEATADEVAAAADDRSGARAVSTPSAVSTPEAVSTLDELEAKADEKLDELDEKADEKLDELDAKADEKLAEIDAQGDAPRVQLDAKATPASDETRA